MNSTNPHYLINSSLTQNQHTWFNQKIPQKSNPIHYASKNYIYENQQNYEAYSRQIQTQPTNAYNAHRHSNFISSMDKISSFTLRAEAAEFIPSGPSSFTPNSNTSSTAKYTQKAASSFTPNSYTSSQPKYRRAREVDLVPNFSDHTPTSLENEHLLDENERISYLICGYSPYEIPPDVQETIRKYSWYQDRQYSLQCIKATHWFSQYIDKYVNSEENKCPYSGNNDFNILSYIYVRGGALRDCYLFREINDIDLVIDIYELSKKFLNHLQKYHSTIEQQGDCKCVYWRRYKNRFEIDQEAINGRDNVHKILALRDHIITADFLLNSRFIVDILRSSTAMIESKYHGQHWLITLHERTYCPSKDEWVGGLGQSVEFDVVDGTDNSYGIWQTFEECQIINELSEDEITSITKGVDRYNLSLFAINRAKMNNEVEKVANALREISIPMYPFPVNKRWYDFTINCGHIDLQSVLINSVDATSINYNWENKMRKKYKSDIINQLNKMAIDDMKAKVIRGPDIGILNGQTAQFYFWRLIKLTQKFIKKINAGLWRIDSKYVARIQGLYGEWFNEDSFLTETNEAAMNREKFVYRLMKWGIKSNDDVIRRFMVFRYIGFESHFMNVLDTATESHMLLLIETIQDNLDKLKEDEVFRNCFRDFGYLETLKLKK